MSLRPPSRYATADLDPIEAALDHEMRGEMASTLGRLHTALEKALRELAEFEASTEVKDAQRRENLLGEAGEALWHATIQRDLCGLRSGTAFHLDFNVPKAVIYRMGVRPKR